MKFIFITTLLTFSFAQIHAQKFSLGVKAGVLFAYPNFADAVDHKNTTSLIKPGFSVAGLIYFPLKKRYSFTSEAGFSQQGRIVSFSTLGTHENNSTYYFADLAMGLRRTFQVRLKQNIISNCFVNIGPNINYWIAGKGKITTDFGITQNYTMIFDQPPGTQNDKMYISNENRWLFGLNFGFGFSAATKKNQKFLTELRLTWGQTYLGKSQSAYWNNLVFQGQESLKFNLKVLNFSVAYIFDKDLRNAKKGKSDSRKRSR